MPPPAQWWHFEGFQCGLIGRVSDLVHQAMLLKPFKRLPLDGDVNNYGGNRSCPLPPSGGILKGFSAD